MGTVLPSDAEMSDYGAKSTKQKETMAVHGSQKKSGSAVEAGQFPSDVNSKKNAAHISRLRIIDLVLRSLVVAFTVVSLCVMLTSTQHSEVEVLGFNIGLSMHWKRSQPFEFLVVVDFLACAYALLQFIHQSVILIKRASPTRKRTLLLLAIDQAFSYLVIAAAAASAGASRTNKSAFRTLGVEQVHIAGVCTVLDRFCNHAMVAFIFTLLAAFCSVAGTAVDIYLLILAL